MTAWRFGESDADGEAWIANPTEMHAYVDYHSPSTGEWRRVMVVTRSWLENQLQHGGRLLLPALVVVADGHRPVLIRQIEEAVSSASLDRFSKALQSG